jgi:hypothetical protein
MYIYIQYIYIQYIYILYISVVYAVLWAMFFDVVCHNPTSLLTPWFQIYIVSWFIPNLLGVISVVLSDLSPPRLSYNK